MESKFRAKYPLSSDIPLKKYFGWKIHLNLQEEWTKKLARYYLIVISLLDCDFDGWLVDEGSSSNRTRTTTPTTPTRRSWPTRCCRRPAPTRRRRTSSPSTRRRTASSWATRRRRSSSSTSTARAWRSAALWSAGSIAGAFHSTTGRNPIGSSHTVAIMPFACEVHLFFFRNQLVVGRDPFDGAKAAELAGAWSTKVTPKWPTVVFLSRSSRSPWGHDPSDTTTTPGGVVTHQIGASAELDSTDCRTRLQKRKTKKSNEKLFLSTRLLAARLGSQARHTTTTCRLLALSVVPSIAFYFSFYGPRCSHNTTRGSTGFFSGLFFFIFPSFRGCSW